MKSQFKKCKICSKDMPKGLLNVCSNKCAKEKEKEKRKVVKLKKSLSVSVLGKLADTLWSKAIRMPWACEYCGKTEFLNAHHIFGRNSKSVRWELANGICLCSGCHTFSCVFSAHKTPTEFTYWLEERRWKIFMDKLQQLAHEPIKITPEYLQEQIILFKKEIDL